MNDTERRNPTVPTAFLWKPALDLLRTLVPVIGVVLFFALLDWGLHGQNATFWSKQNLQTISVQNAFVAIAALGMLLVIIAGGIDLSAGMAIALCATIIGWGMREDVAFLLVHGENVAGAVKRLHAAEDLLRLARQQADAEETTSRQVECNERQKQLRDLLAVKLDALRAMHGTATGPSQIELASRVAQVERAFRALDNPDAILEADPVWLRALPNSSASGPLALLMGLAAGLLCGLLNGALIVALGVMPFIATLGTMTIYLGLAKIVADETVVRPLPIQVPTWLGELAAVRPDPAWLLVSKGVWLALFLAAIVAGILRYTVFGRHVFAVGSNELTARLCGVNVPLVKVSVYALSGLMVGIASICFFARLNSGSPTAGTGLELKFIAAVVIGGGSLNGGRGTVLGTLAGTALTGVIASGCTLLGMRNPLQDILLGAIIIAAVTADHFRQRSA